MKTFLIAMGLLSFLGIANAAELDVGATVPDAPATTHLGEAVQLKDLFAKGTTAVFFYPKADTPGCTKQACSLRDGFADLQKLGVQVIGVSFDTVEAQKAFVEKYKLPYTLLADPEGKVVAAFGVPATGKFAKRQAYLVRDSKVVWRSLAASTDKQAADLVAAVNAL